MTTTTPFLMICAPPSDWTGATEIVCGLSGYPAFKKVEPAGKHYEEWLMYKTGQKTAPSAEATKADEETDDKEDDQMTAEQREKYEQKRHKKLIQGKIDDPYELLGLEQLRWMATDDDIKQAYRKLVLKYHPDKNTEINDEIFKKISEANDLLNDPKRRRAYDSSDEDTSYNIPSFTEGVDDFFSVFGGTFMKFSKWSVNKNVPRLGDNNTPYEQVKKFYDFWYEFKSWREFSFADEFDVNDAESRDEKRWMERQNERTRRKSKKEEMAKIRKLTEMAEKFDPRVRKFKEEQKAKKDKVKEERAQQLREKQEEVERIAAAEKEKKEMEEKKKAEEALANKKLKAAENKKMKKLRNKIRAYCITEDSGFRPPLDDVELICARLTLEQLSSLASSFEQANLENSKKSFEEMLGSIKQVDAEREKKERDDKGVSASGSNSGKPWTEEELSMLAKAVAKFPGGITDRWEQIANFVGTRTVKEIISKTKETKFIPNKPSNLAKFEDAYDRFNKVKKKSDTEISSETSVRDETEMQGNNNAATPASTATAATGVAPAATATATAAKTAKPAEWSADEQKALEKALSSVPATATDRWDRIAELVPGKNKKDCILRYKFLVQQIKEKKAAK